jgi:phage tail-like protein
MIARSDPYRGFRFLVESEGIALGGFTEVQGLAAEVKVTGIKEGGVNDHVHKIPDGVEYPNLVLKRGLADSHFLWDWHKDVLQGKVERRNIFVVLLDESGNEAWRWTFQNAYPIKWTGPGLRADSSAVAVETLELVHEGIK